MLLAIQTLFVYQNAPGLPKTRSGKIMRRVLKKIANDDHELGDISTMADGSVVEVEKIFNFFKNNSGIFIIDTKYLPGSLQLQGRDDAKQEEQMNLFLPPMMA